MLYLLDANVLINANRDYYPMDRVSEFWEWLVYMGNMGQVKIPLEIFEEIRDGSDDDVLAIWAKKPEIEEALLFDEEADAELVSTVVNQGYANDLTDDEIERLGRDPFIIAYALKDTTQRCVVTAEVSKPKATRSNRHVPDVCNTLNISWRSPFKFINDLNFSTHWKSTLK